MDTKKKVLFLLSLHYRELRETNNKQINKHVYSVILCHAVESEENKVERCDREWENGGDLLDKMFAEDFLSDIWAQPC